MNGTRPPMPEGAESWQWRDPAVLANSGPGQEQSQPASGKEPDSEDAGSIKCLIEAEIIPRLLIAHATHATNGAAMPDIMTSGLQDAAERIATVAVANDLAAAAAVVQSLIDRGHPVDRIFVDVLAPAARQLGTMWESDEVNFVDVTVALTRLQQLVRRFSPPREMPRHTPHSVRRLLLAPTPGEQHTFGLMLVEDTFRRAGWDVAGGIAMDGLDVEEILHAQAFDVVGFSLASERLLDRLASTIERVRTTSNARDLKVIVGGRMFSEDRSAYSLVGADASASDAHEALRIAESLLQGSAGAGA
ncbi:MAG: cobalamin B12-binding domain-containing protein [Hyphomicrobiaceae bacterium]|nr:cobalamin B12-binding domain-containing protein [Hyphomicrobiaceae bacterium]